MVRTKRVYSGATLLRVLYPVGFCMLFVAINVRLLHPLKYNVEIKEVFFGLMNSYDTDQSVYPTLLLMTFLVVTTCLGVLAYKKKYYKAIKMYIFANSVALLVVYASIHSARVARAQSVPISLPTAVFLILNFGGLGVVGIHWKASRRVNQFYLIMLAAFTALFLLQVLPDWTVWIAITVISIWDIFAVLFPYGPLKVLLETAHRRGDDHFPAILYNASSIPGTPETTRSDNIEMSTITSPANTLAPPTASSSLSTTPLIPRRTREVREVDGTIRLGMGDFVFYSLMLGNVVQTTFSLPTVLACLVANLTGLTITLPVVTLAQTALPALPFPLMVAALFYFSSQIALMPFTNSCSTRMLLF